MLAGGGIDFAAGRSERSAGILYGWAESSELCQPVRGQTGRAQPRGRHHRLRPVRRCGPVAEVLRANGVVDTEPYRKLGRNQLRIAMFPAIDPDDVAALTACIDHVVGRL